MSKRTTFPYVYVKIGEVVLTSSPDNVISISSNRVSDVASQSFTLVCYDESALVLEAMLIEGAKQLQVAYGWSPSDCSPTYNLVITNYVPEFNAKGTTLTIEAYMQESVSLTSSTQAKTYTGKISDIVTEICNEEGWAIGHIETTQVIELPEGDTSLTRSNQTARDFIKQNLCPLAKSLDGKSGYEFYFKSHDGVNKAYFQPVDDETEVVSRFEYVIGRSHDNIISFSPDFAGVLAALLGAAETETVALDSYTNQIIKIGSGSDSSFKRRVGVASYTNSELVKISDYLWTQASKLAYTATLEMVGKVNIEPMDTIALTVLTTDGLPHHTSGVYVVISVQDDIDATFTTTLNLMRRALVVEDGEIRLAEDSETILSPGIGGNGTTPGIGSQNSSTGTDNPSTGGGTPGAGVPASQLKTIVDSYLGIPYVWGGKSKSTGLDCSGFVKCVMKDLGVTVGSSTTEQRKNGVAVTPISISNLRPGDLLFQDWDNDGVQEHVMIYMGGNTLAHAPKTGDVVKYVTNIDYYMKYTKWVRRVL